MTATSAPSVVSKSNSTAKRTRRNAEAFWLRSRLQLVVASATAIQFIYLYYRPNGTGSFGITSPITGGTFKAKPGMPYSANGSPSTWIPSIRPVL